MIRRTFVCRYRVEDGNKTRICGVGWWMEWDKDPPPTCPNGKRKGFAHHVLTELAPTYVTALSDVAAPSRAPSEEKR